MTKVKNVCASDESGNVNKQRTPFPVKTKKNLNLKVQWEKVIIMTKKHSKKLPKNSPRRRRRSSNDIALEAEENNALQLILRDGAAYVQTNPGPSQPPPRSHRQRLFQMAQERRNRRILVPETPEIQCITISSTSDDSVVFLDETPANLHEIVDAFSSDDENEDEAPPPPDEAENVAEAPPPAENTIEEDAPGARALIPIPIYSPAFGAWVTPAGDHVSWRKANPEVDTRLVDSDNYPESSPEMMRLKNFKDGVPPGYTRCETGRFVRFHGYTYEPPEQKEANEENENDHLEQEEAAEENEIDPLEQEEADEENETNPLEQEEAVEDAELSEILNVENENILAQTTTEFEVNYDSAENLNLTWNDSLISQVPSEELLVDLLEGMRNMNRQFRVLLDQNEIYDENWPRQLTPTQRLEKYELGFQLARSLGIAEQYCFPHPRTFHGVVYHGISYNRAPPLRVQNVLNLTPGSPIPVLYRPVTATYPDEDEDFVEGAQALDPLLPEPEEAQAPAEPLLHPQLEAEHEALTNFGHAALDREAELNPGLINPVDNPFENYGMAVDDEPPIMVSRRNLRQLLVRCTYRAEIMSFQLDNALGRESRPVVSNAWTRNTFQDLLARYDQVAISMDERENENPTINVTNIAPIVTNIAPIRQSPHWFWRGATSTPSAPETEPEIQDTSAIDTPAVQNDHEVNLEIDDVPNESNLDQNLDQNSNQFEMSSITFEAYDGNGDSDDSFLR